MRRASFGEFVVLSILLHMLGILLFGSTSGSGTPGGKAYWGTLAVTLPFPLAAPGIGLRLDRGGDLAVPGKAQRRQPERSKDALPRMVPEAPNVADKPIAPPAPVEKTETPAPMIERIAPQSITPPLAQ